MSRTVRVALLALALLSVGAARGPQIIPNPETQGWSLIVPRASPVRFRRFDRNGVAHFEGRFVLTGTFTYGCELCEDDIREEYLELAITPDPPLAARLPHWNVGATGMTIYLTRDRLLARAVGTPAQRRALLSGKLNELHGRVAVVVDNFEAGGDCDSPTYLARYVSTVELPKVIELQNDRYGCG